MIEGIDFSALGTMGIALAVTVLYSVWFRSDMLRLLAEVKDEKKALSDALIAQQQRHERQLIECYAPPVAPRREIPHSPP